MHERLQQGVEAFRHRHTRFVEDTEPYSSLYALWLSAWYLLFSLFMHLQGQSMYENLFLTAGAALFGLLPLLRHRVPAPFSGPYTLLSTLSLLFLPLFYHFFMLMKNQWVEPWGMATLGVCLLVLVLAEQSLLVLVMLIAAFAAATAVLAGIDGANPFAHARLSYLPIACFTLGGAALITRRRRLVQSRRLALHKSLGGTIAHEMRTPLSAIGLAMGSIRTELARSRALAKPTESILSAIEASVGTSADTVVQCNRLIESILATMREGGIDSGNFRLLDAREAIVDALEGFAYAETDDRKLVHLEADDDFEFLGDRTLFVHTIYNLLQNAFHYRNTPGFDITVATRRTGEMNRVVVRDRGPGVEACRQELVFDHYHTEGKEGGSGLGLSFCRMVVESFGGTIACNSVPEGGSEFVIDLPAYRSEGARRLRRKVMQSKRVLVALASRDERRMASRTLRRSGCVVELAEEPRKALEMAAGTSYSMILTNLEMEPLLREARSLPVPGSGGSFREPATSPLTRASIVAVADEGESEAEVKRLVAEAGMDGYLLRPFAEPDIEMLLERLLDDAAAPQGASLPPHEPLPLWTPPEGATILVADDSDALRRLLKINLEYYGYRVLLAADGREAVEMAASHKLSLAVLDHTMPVMGGIEAARQMSRQAGALGGVPVILLSGLSTEQLAAAVKGEPIERCLPKPFTSEQLVHAIGELLMERNGNGGESRALARATQIAGAS